MWPASEFSPGVFIEKKKGSVKRRDYFLKQWLQHYLQVCGAFPVDDVVVQLGMDLPHGAVGAGQGVGDDDVQGTAGGRKNHSARWAHGGWQEEETDMRSRDEERLFDSSPSLTHEYLIYESWNSFVLID